MNGPKDTAATGCEPGLLGDAERRLTDAESSAPKAVVIANPKSGSSQQGEKLAEEVERFEPDFELRPTTEADPGEGQAAGAASAGVETIVAAGGDGTVRAVIESVAGSDSTLGIVPLGTGNLLAGNLGIEKGIDSVETALTGGIRQLDVGTVNGERFAVMSGVGFDALMIRDANPKLKRRFGTVAYVLSAVRHLRIAPFDATLSVDGVDAWRGSTVMVLVANCGQVSGGLEVFPDAQPDDGLLDVAVLCATNFRQWVSVLWRFARHRPQPPELVFRSTGTRFIVTLSRPLEYELDGEVRDPVSVLEYGIEPSALQVKVPSLPATATH